MIKAAVGVETEGYTHQLYFNYPLARRHRIAPARARQRRCRKITPDFTVERVWKEAGQWCVSNGRVTRRYQNLISTIPIQELAHAVEGVPAEIIAAVDSLRYNSLITVAVGFDHARLPGLHRDLRTRSRDPVSSPVVPGACSARTMRRTASPSWKPKSPPIPATARTKCRMKQILADVIGDLESMDLIAHQNEVCYGRVIRTKYGYVVQDDNYRRHLETGQIVFRTDRHPALRTCGRIRVHQHGRVHRASTESGGAVEPRRHTTCSPRRPQYDSVYGP